MNHSAVSSNRLSAITHQLSPSRGKFISLLIIAALFAFELFNYSTTEFALNDLLGGLRFASIRWATILAIAFCGIDFAGIARLFTPAPGVRNASETGITRVFTPKQDKNETKEVWYLFGAWLLAATMNAMLTWWGVALAIVNHESLGGNVIARETLVDVVPVFVAIMVWLIRVLIIGAFSVAGNRLYTESEPTPRSHPEPVLARSEQVLGSAQSAPLNFRPIPKSNSPSSQRLSTRPDPTYHPASSSGYNHGGQQVRH